MSNKCYVKCNEYINTDCVVYKSDDLPNIGVDGQRNLTTILKLIDEKLEDVTASTLYLEAGDNMSITGTGTELDPYIFSASGFESALTFSTGLNRSVNTITATIATGKSGGQTAYGGTGASENLVLSSTTSGTKGKIIVGATTGDEIQLTAFPDTRDDGPTANALYVDASGNLKFGPVAGAGGWSTLGNAGTVAGTNFLGTTDTQSLVFKINSVFAGVIPYRAGNDNATLSLGVNAGAAAAVTARSTAIGQNAMRYATGFDNVAYGSTALHLLGSVAGLNEANLAIGTSAWYAHTIGYRNTIVGNYAGGFGSQGNYNVGLGTFVLEHSRGDLNTAVGDESMRGNRNGNQNTAGGFFSLGNNSSTVTSIAVTNGGSGYTSATVTIDPPDAGTPGATSIQATATATVLAGAVTGITITEMGRGYDTTPSVTINGDGTGATALATLSSGHYNTAFGGASGFNNRAGQYNSWFGYSTFSNELWDDKCTHLGALASRDSGVTALTKLTNATSIGYNAKVSTSNTLVLGGTGADQPNVVIGGKTGSELLTLGTAGSQAGIMSMAGGTSGKIIFQTAAAAGTWTLTWPTNDGTSGQVLSTDGNGVTSWIDVSSGSGGTGASPGGFLTLENSTADATPTSLGNVTGLPTYCVGMVTMIMTGLFDADTGITGEKKVRFTKNGSTITLGTIVDIMADEVDTALTGATWTIATSGGNIFPQVTGLAATGISWKVSYTIQLLEYIP